MSDILKTAESLNADVARLNKERSKMEGMLESAKNNYEKAIADYEQRYGVRLTDETIQSEYNNVFAHVKGSLLSLNEKVESIKRGDYKQDAETVEFDLEPDVEPIREDKKKEPAKRGRKKATKKEEVAEVSVESIEAQAAEIPDTEPVAPIEDDVKIDNGPLNMNLDFGGFAGYDDNGSYMGVEPAKAPVVETPVAESKQASKGKTLSMADLSAAMKATDVTKQHPVEAVVSEDEEPVIPEQKVVETPKVETPVAETTTDSGFGGFGGFGDFGGFGGFDTLGVEPAEAPAEPKADVKHNKADDEVDLSSFTFGGFGDIAPSEPKKEVASTEPKEEENTGFGGFSEVQAEPKKEDNGFGDFGGFGGFGGFGNVQADTQKESKPTMFGGFGGLSDADFKTIPDTPKPAEKKEQPDLSVGWGSFGAADFDNMLNSAAGLKFGE